ncbi:hypothetical protein K443DRAFT_115518, partial [Laccaria amethystina LaAM-08-1]
LLVSGPEETRGIHHRVLKISVVLCFRRMVYPIFTMSLEGPEETRVLFEAPEETRGSRARLQCIIVAFEGAEEMTTMGAPIPMLSCVFCFFGGDSVSGNS